MNLPQPSFPLESPTMSQHLPPEVVVCRSSRPWGRRPVRTYTGPLREIRQLLPRFTQCGSGAFIDDADHCTVARVSPQYVLVQHEELVDAVHRTLVGDVEGLEDLRTQLVLSERGARMEMSFLIPQAGITPDDGHALFPLVRCLNSVDGSTRLSADLHWHRVICANGMWAYREYSCSRAHRWSDPLGHVLDGLSKELTLARKSRDHLNELLRLRISEGSLRDWVDVFVHRHWGWNAAANVWHICQSGHCGDVTGSLAEQPHETSLRNPKPVPGACAPVRNLYHVWQALSWVASSALSYETMFRRLEHCYRLLHLLRP